MIKPILTLPIEKATKMFNIIREGIKKTPKINLESTANRQDNYFYEKYNKNQKGKTK